jgi:hypothetical protein
LNADGFKLVGDKAGCVSFLKGQFGMRMQVPAGLNDVGRVLVG